MVSSRRTERLKLIEIFYPHHDAPIKRTSEIESFGRSDCDLICGQDSELLLCNFSIEEAQDYFGREQVRVVIKCPSCSRYNLLAAALEKLENGGFVILPRREE